MRKKTMQPERGNQLSKCEHEFVSLLKSQKPILDKVNIEISDTNRTTINLQQLSDALTIKEYVIICRKCGEAAPV